MSDLRELRERQLLTQKELAERLGVAISSVQTWENGIHRPRPGAMRRLCTVLDVTPAALRVVLDTTRRRARSTPGEEVAPR